MSKRTVNPKAAFRRDFAYIRLVLQQADAYMKRGDWHGVELSLREISGVAANGEAEAMENRLNIKDAQFMDSWEIENILAARKIEAAIEATYIR